VPIYEYSCQKCRHQFEALVRAGGAEPTCPSCGSEQLERLFSLPAVRSETTRDLAMRAAKRRDAKLGRERVEEQRLYEQAHDAEGQ